MYNTYREHHPLLSDENSADETTDDHTFNKTSQSIYNRSRSKIKLKGAAAIMKRWPDHWCPVAYWWTGLTFFCIVLFIMYNSVLAYPILPRPYILKPWEAKHNSEKDPVSNTEVYMHIIVDNEDEVDLNKYMSYITKLSDTYKDFRYNFIILVNNTFKEDVADYHQNNLDAFDVLTSPLQVVYEPKMYAENLKIQYISLSSYLDNSPLKLFWKRLPPEFMNFFVRAVSIWEKGGIALNPALFISEQSYSKYFDNIHKVFKNFMKIKKKPTTKIISKPLIKVNNIRDIIEALENENVEDNHLEPLSEAENINMAIQVIPPKPYFTKSKHNETAPTTSFESSITNSSGAMDNTNKDTLTSNANFDSNNGTLYSKFMDLLFHGSTSTSSQAIEKRSLNEKPELSEVTKGEYQVNNDKIINIYPRQKKDDSNYLNEKENYNISIDLKGNIVATKTPCHALLGSMFTNSIKHSSKETITDFITSEILKFCKGILSSCKGVDVILM